MYENPNFRVFKNFNFFKFSINKIKPKSVNELFPLK